MYELDAVVLLLGVGHDRNTSLHLAQYRTGRLTRVPQSGPVRARGAQRWISRDDINLDTEDFSALGSELDETNLVRLGRAGRATTRLMRQRHVVNHATAWFTRKPTTSP